MSDVIQILDSRNGIDIWILFEQQTKPKGNQQFSLDTLLIMEGLYNRPCIINSSFQLIN